MRFFSSKFFFNKSLFCSLKYSNFFFEKKFRRKIGLKNFHDENIQKDGKKFMLNKIYMIKNKFHDDKIYDETNFHYKIFQD